jgi:hypothetical protein
MDGSIPNDEGFVCVGGMDWTSTEQEYCTDGDGLYFPNLPIEEDHPDDSGGGGGGGDGGGWDPGGDGEGPITDPWPDPIDPVPAPLEEPVSKAETAKIIREVCQNVPGLTLPSNDSDLWPYFQASARKSVNQYLASDPDRQIQWYQNQSHPQLTNDVDGYATAFSVDGVPLPNVVTTIMEVKFSENPSDAWSSSQWSTHIDDG